MSYLNESNEYCSSFFNNVLNTSSTYYNREWVKLILSGHSNPPRHFKETSKLIEYVNNNKGAIGFVPANEKDKLKSNCKVIVIE